MARLAGIDLGSNSFHLLIVDVDKDGQRKTVLRQKQKVQLRAGLNEDLNLSDTVMQRALDCLKMFSDTIEHHQVDQISVKGTYTLRKIQNPDQFLKRAETILQHKIDIISGEEEARLIYLGATYDNLIESRQLVVDIGGGSTELIVGENHHILELTSLEMGCVSFQNVFFADGKLNDINFDTATAAAKKLLAPIAGKFIQIGWQNVFGSAGTIRSVSNILQAQENGKLVEFDLYSLCQIRDQLVAIKQVEAIQLPGLREDRENILPGGLSILIAIFDMLNIDKMILAAGGIREGTIIEML